MTNILLCGGSGTRLWPLSRTLMPKQFVKLFAGEAGKQSLFQKTVQRNEKLCDAQLIVSNTEQYFLAVDQTEELSLFEQKSRYLLEPIGRNTAPAIALACMMLHPEETVLVTPSDHLIKDEAAYGNAVAQAAALAETGALVTFGITPNYPETGFGYIESDTTGTFEVRAFHEKPDAATAQRYLDAGNYYWNSGMFCFRAGVFLCELERHAPEIFLACKQAFESRVEIADGQYRIPHELMAAIPEESIDYAVMERSERVKVIPTEMGWNDLGSFDALYEELEHDSSGNALLLTDGCDASPVAIDAADNLIISDKQVAVIDVEGLCVVDTADALLISHRGSGQKVKEVVAHLKANGSDLPNVHVTAHRPWGNYTILDEEKGYKVKRIVVKPGRRLSLQKHFHRSEHWIVVSGTAKVTREGGSFLVCANESTYISIGEIHRLENAGKIPLVMIEAQVGEYLGEDDIVRIEDDFARS